MIVVFVSRDAGEFNRYLSGSGEVVSGNLSYRPLGELLAGSSELNNAQVSELSAVFDPFTEDIAKANKQREALEKSQDAKDIHVEYMYSLRSLQEFRKSGVFVLVIRSGDEINRLKERCRTERYCRGNTEDFLRLISSVLNDLSPVLKAISSDNGFNLAKHDVHLLVHWGGLPDLDAEEDVFRKAIQEQHLEKVVGCNNLFIREISTRRPCFDVTGSGPIVVPVKKDDVDAALSRFDDARTFARMKDVLTGFVVKGQTKGKDLVCKFLARDDVRDDLRSALLDRQTAWLKDWKAFRDYLDAEPGKAEPDKAGSDKEKPDKVEEEAKKLLSEGARSKAFVTLLLTDRQLLSEGLLT